MKYWVGCYYSSHLDEVASFYMMKKDQGVTWNEHIIHVRDFLGQLLIFQRQAARQISLKCAKVISTISIAKRWFVNLINI